MLLRLLNSGVIAQDRIDFDNGESFNKPTSGAWMRMTIRFNGEVRVNLGGEGVQTNPGCWRLGFGHDVDNCAGERWLGGP